MAKFSRGRDEEESATEVQSEGCADPWVSRAHEDARGPQGPQPPSTERAPAADPQLAALTDNTIRAPHDDRLPVAQTHHRLPRSQPAGTVGSWTAPLRRDVVERRADDPHRHSDQAGAEGRGGAQSPQAAASSCPRATGSAVPCRGRRRHRHPPTSPKAQHRGV